jgi:PAS domain S-box-containing protein
MTADRFLRAAWERRLAIGFCLAIATLAFTRAAQIRAIFLMEDAEQLVTRTESSLGELQGVMSEIREMESLARAYVATGSPLFVDRMGPAEIRARRHLAELGALPAGNPVPSSDARALAELAPRGILFLRELVTARRDRGVGEAAELLTSGEGVRVMEQLTATGDRLAAEQRLQLAQRRAAGHSDSALAVRLSAVGTLGSLVFLFFAGTLWRVDLRKRRHAEATLVSEREFSSVVLENLHDGIIACDASGVLTRVNRAAREMHGSAGKAIPLEQWADYYEIYAHGETTRLTGEEMPLSLALRGRRLIGEELRLVAAGGSIRDILVNGQPLRDAEGRKLGAVIAIRDVTEARAAAELLRSSEELYRSVVAAMAEGVVVHQSDGKISAYNEAALRILGLTADQLLGQTSNDLDYRTTRENGTPFPGEEHPAMMTLRTGRPCSNVCMRIHKQDGLGGRSESWILINAEPVEVAGSVVATFTDITGLKRAEATVRNSLAEKEVLLREIHHRVRNNLQIVTSLLRMQGNSSRDEATRALFRDSENRVLSMAAVHESLQGTTDFGRVDLTRYLRRVVDLVAASWQAPDVVCSVEGTASATVSVQAAVPCGLIVNELVSNSLKHAFRGAPGRVVVSVQSRPPGMRIAVEDDGPGFDPAAGKGLGLQLVRTLANQLHGAIRFREGAGSRIEIEFSA